MVLSLLSLSAEAGAGAAAAEADNEEGDSDMLDSSAEDDRDVCTEFESFRTTGDGL